jgi:hypothetical protein
MSLGSFLTKIMPADSMATLVPASITTPTSDYIKTGASLIPSPTIITLKPF